MAKQQLFTNASPAEQLQRFWQYCSKNLISDKDSAATCQWLISVEKEVDSLHNEQLKGDLIRHFCPNLSPKRRS